MTIPWEVHCASGLSNAVTHLAREHDLAAERALVGGPPVALVWQSEPALVVTQSERHLPQFDQAVRLASEEGWPVCVRSTGGAAVALTPGVVNVGLILPWRERRPTLEAGFRWICDPVIRALDRFDVAAGTGSAPGSFCDGRFNVLVGTRKIAGTSQRHFTRRSRGALLLHATVIVDADPAELTEAVARFYARAGGRRDLDATSITSLARCMRGPAPASLPQAFAAAFCEVLRLGRPQDALDQAGT